MGHVRDICVFVIGMVVMMITPTASGQRDIAWLRADDRRPEAVEVPSSDQPSQQDVSGWVTDPTGAAIQGANVVLVNSITGENRVLLTDSSGAFNFAGVSPGSFRISITSKGFAEWKVANFVVQPGQHYQVPTAVLQVASESTTVQVGFTPHDVAEEQLRVQEQQRLLGWVPNFYVSYIWNATPLSAGQKFSLAWKTTLDPVAFVSSGIIAGWEQAQNNYSGYGQGAQGYAKRFGANYADNFTSTMLGDAVLPSLFHQDPRYFYKGKGGVISRAFYAMATTVVCRSDHGGWQPNYSNVLGTFGSAGISNLYYPARSRGTNLILNTIAVEIAGKATVNLLQEFVLREVTPSVSKSVPGATQLILKDGTRAPLMIIEGLDSKTAAENQPLTLVLIEDIKVGGVVVAKSGCKAFGELTARQIDSSGKSALNIRLKYLQIGNERVRLRNSKKTDSSSGADIVKDVYIRQQAPIVGFIDGDFSVPAVP